MTQEEKARAYDEALNKAKIEINTKGIGETVNLCEQLFPELRESEDEKIRKHLIEIVETYWGTTNEPGKAADLDWLEKQKEQKHNYCLYGGYPNVGRCRWCSAACSARLADVHTDEEKEYIRTIKSIISDFIRDKKPENLAYYQRIYDWLDGKPADPVFSKQEYESHPIISTDTTSAKPVERSLEDDHIIGFVYDLLNEIEWKDDWAMSKEECLRLLSNYSPQKFTGATINGEPISTENQSVDIPLAEWSEEDEEMRDTCIDLLKHFPRPCGEVIGPWKDCTAWLKSLPEKFVLQPKQEWDVEDKLMIKCCLEAINVYKHKAKRGKFLPAQFNISGYLASPEKVESWLKFLPGRFNLQPKQEWSDEDEHRRDGIIQWLREYQEKFNPKYDSLSIESIESLIDWLKSIRPSWKPSEQEKGALRTAIHVLTEERNFPKAAAQLQNILDAFEGKESRKDWKPSEEQMGRLFSIVAALRKDYCDDMADFLASIYHNLKKLM